MTYVFNITGETPAKKNSRINLKNGCSIPSKRFREWQEKALVQLRLQSKPQEPIDYPVYIRLSFTHGDLRRRDSDNGCSSILDMLQKAQIIKDDNWQIVREIKIVNQYVKNEPECVIMIQPYEE